MHRGTAGVHGFRCCGAVGRVGDVGMADQVSVRGWPGVVVHTYACLPGSHALTCSSAGV